MAIAILLWVVCGIAAAFVASSRGASGCLWFGLGVLLGPLGLALSFAALDQKKCPYCQSGINSQATRCPRCHATLEAEGTPDRDDAITRALVARMQAQGSGTPASVPRALAVC